MYTARVPSKGWVVIPKPLRERYGIKLGSVVRFVDYGNSLVIVPQRDNPVEAAYGSLRRPRDGYSATDAYLEEKRAERAREEQRVERRMRS